MKVFLCGAGIPAKEILSILLDQIDDIAIFTHKDTLITPSLGGVAQQAGIWFTLENINTTPLPFQPDYIISIYYRYLFKKPILDLCPAFNAHTSLLPRHRGRSPVTWAIVEGDKITGITYHYIDEGVDTGPIILQAAVQIAADETQQSLFGKINQAAIDYFPPALELVLSGFKGLPQKGEATHHPKGLPYNGEIDSNWPWARIERFVKAMTYPPLAPARFHGRNILTMEDYRMALFERHRENSNRQPVSG